MQQIKVNIPHFYNETELCTYLVQGGNGMRTNSRNLDQMERRILAKNKKNRLQEKKQTKKNWLSWPTVVNEAKATISAQKPKSYRRFAADHRRRIALINDPRICQNRPIKSPAAFRIDSVERVKNMRSCFQCWTETVPAWKPTWISPSHWQGNLVFTRSSAFFPFRVLPAPVSIVFLIFICYNYYYSNYWD